VKDAGRKEGEGGGGGERDRLRVSERERGSDRGVDLLEDVRERDIVREEGPGQ
jgi:hypothetical protein